MNDCSKPSLGGQVAAICFPAVWWKLRRWIWCRWAVFWKLQRFVALQIWPDTNCALWHSRVTFRASWVTRFAMLQMGCPSLLLGRQNRFWKMSTRSRNSEFWINRGSVSYSPDTSCQLAESFPAASRLLHHVWNMQSYWSASGGRVQLSSDLHEWTPCMMSFGSWKVIHGECHLQFLRQGHPSCRGQRAPEMEESVCLFNG